MIKKSLIILIIVLSFNTAKATVLFETGVGYTLGRYDLLGTDTHGEYKGLYLSGRLCHNFDNGIFTGIDFRVFSLLNTVSGDPAFETSLLNTSRGFVFGFTPKERLRIWFSYQFINTFEMPLNSNEDITLKDGKAFIAGIGYMGIEWISVNVEYATYYFDEYENNGNLLPLSNDYSIRTFMITFSFPMDF